jgi:RimJ/RimL family protein N-acetyltransferase
MISTARLTLKQFDESFLTAKYVSWLNDKTLMQFSEQRHMLHTIDSCQKYWKDQLILDNLLLAIVRKKDDCHVGNITASVDKTKSSADLGILMGEKLVHGQGYGKEAWCALMNYLFLEKGIKTITGGAMAGNLPMISIFKSCGMMFTQKQSNICKFNGVNQAVEFYQADSQEWEPCISKL